MRVHTYMFPSRIIDKTFGGSLHKKWWEPSLFCHHFCSTTMLEKSSGSGGSVSSAKRRTKKRQTNVGDALRRAGTQESQPHFLERSGHVSSRWLMSLGGCRQTTNQCWFQVDFRLRVSQQTKKTQECPLRHVCVECPWCQNKKSKSRREDPRAMSIDVCSDVPLKKIKHAC